MSHEHTHEHSHIHSHEHDYHHSHDYSHDHDYHHSHDHSHELDHHHSHDHSHELDHHHSHDHSHEYGHSHVHTHSVASSPEEALALLKYMLDHNRHHAEELHDLAHCFEAEIADLVHDAVDKLQESNDLMEQALALLNNDI